MYLSYEILLNTLTERIFLVLITVHKFPDLVLGNDLFG